MVETFNVTSLNETTKMKPLRSLQVALHFMTTLPVPAPKWLEGDARRSVRMYPLVGLVLGSILLIAFYLLAGLPPLLRGALLTGLWLLLTGALHFDGFCDLADAAFASKPVEERQRIAKDASVGAFALAAGATLLLVKTTALGSLAGGGWLVVVLVLGRTLLLVPMALFKVNESSRLGRSTRINLREAFFPLALGLVLSGLITILFLNALAWLLGLIVTTFVLLALAWWLNRRMGGLSGDAYGTLIETGEATLLVCVVVL